MPDEIADIWQTIERWCARRAPTLVDALAGPVTDEALREARSGVDPDFPDDLVAALRIHDGWEAYVVHGTWRLLSASEMAEAWRRFEAVGFDDDPALPSEGEPDGPVAPVFWSDGWLPVAEAAQGRFACLDLAPPPEGSAGQVVDVWPQSPERTVLAASWSSWLGRFADDLAAGGYWLEGETSLVPTEEAGSEHREQGSEREGVAGGRSRASDDPGQGAEFLEMLADAGMVAFGQDPSSAAAAEVAGVLADEAADDHERARRLLEILGAAEAVERVDCEPGELGHLLARW